MSKQYKGSIFTRKTSSGRQYLYYKSPYINEGKQISSGLENTKPNRTIVEKILTEATAKNTLNIKDQDEILTTIGECFQDFIYYLENIKKAKPKTVVNYKAAYKHIVSSNYIVNVGDIRPRGKVLRIEKDITKFMARADLSDNAKNIYLRGFRVFCNWLADEKYIEKLNFKNFFASNTQKKVHAYQENEMQALLSYFENDHPNEDIRDWIQFLMLTGSRATESIRLEWKANIDFKKKVIIFPKKNKAGKFDHFPIEPKKLEPLLLKLQKKAKQREKNPHKVFKWSDISYPQKTFIKALKDLDIKVEGAALHSTRKYFITKLVKLFPDNPIIVKDLARHESLDITLKYYHDKKTSELSQALSKYVENL